MPRQPRAVYIRRRLVAALVGVGLVGGAAVVAAQTLGSGDDDGGSVATETSTTSAATTTAAPPTAPTSATVPATSASAATTIATTIAASTSAPTTTSVTTSVTPASTSITVTTDPSAALPFDPAAPVVDAAAYGVYDLTSGEWMTATNADVQRPVGSIMKLLTAYVVMQAGDPAKVVMVPTLTLDPKESAIGLYAGEQLPRDVLLRAMMIVSANDAAEALAVDIGGTRDGFVEMMNAAADELGLDGTVATNPSGLDGGGAVSTARDAVTLAVELMKDETFRTTVARRDARLHGQTFPATNELLGTYPGADGIKTGSTTQGGYGIVASATRDGRQVIVVVLGAPSDASRFAHARTLLDWAFATTP